MDELWSFVGNKRDEWWVWVAPDSGTRQVVAGLAQAYALDEGYRSANMPHLAVHRDVAFAVPLEIAFPAGARMSRVYDKDGVTIDATLVAHDPVKPALGYVLRYKGKKVFISGDTEVSPVNMEAMRKEAERRMRDGTLQGEFKGAATYWDVVVDGRV